MSVEKVRTYEECESDVRSYCRFFPFELETAENAIVTLSSGEKYIDFLSGCGSLNYGHNNNTMKEALLRYISMNGIAHTLDFYSTSKKSFIETFKKKILSPRKLDYKIQFTGPTGANAVEAALKLARKVTGRTNVIAFTNGFHGVSLGALSLTGNRANRAVAGLALHGVTRAPYDGYFGPQFDTVQWLDQMLTDPSAGIEEPAAFIVETVQGEGGLNVASIRWMRALRALASKHGALLIIDDVQAGCGRTGTFFSFESAQIVPDIVVLAKSLSGFGLPFAAVLLAPQHDVWQPGEHNGTFRGNNHAFVTAQTAIDNFWSDDSFTQSIAKNIKIMETALAKLQSATGWPSKGRGMMQGLCCPTYEIAASIRARCVQTGLILELCGPCDETIKLMPPLTIEESVLHDGLERFSEAVLSVGNLAAVSAKVRSKECTTTLG
ncbi:diaminobutyrate--2-oxoglutarate transaminase [Mesorhizobium sp.]|uniref:diaminobutyrate--2-oxoglutarate transaminase n=1 Tax=Mesorhizobium sp. TaxID=1871066 RepID=UPI000FE77643|nr:diaminobutyrate--2-oxoglutarate transaminase [Mesorhizobium sp.]RWB25419.1 MAG: diaminobutyrate--2-oxoglutarate transaminase [Mesorhizobium sp.]